MHVNRKEINEHIQTISIPEIYAFPLLSPGVAQYILPSYLRWEPEI